LKIDPVNKIPIENIYYLLCYAWDRLEEKEIISVSEEENSNVIELLTRVLTSGMGTLIKRGLDKNYIEIIEDTSRIRGKIDFSKSIKRNLIRNAKLTCIYDEYSLDVIHNQIIKSTIHSLIKCRDIKFSQKDKLRSIISRLHGISDIKIKHKDFKKVVLNRNNIYYDFILKICELIYNNMSVNEEDGTTSFFDFIQEQKAMEKLFESFLENFYRIELKNKYRVRGQKHIDWKKLKPLNTESEKHIPKMKMDILLESNRGDIIIDAKYYKEALQSYYEKESIHSGNLYQLYAYLKNFPQSKITEQKCRGMLIYPTTTMDYNLTYDLDGHQISINTINLNQHWTKIHDDLLGFID